MSFTGLPQELPAYIAMLEQRIRALETRAVSVAGGTAPVPPGSIQPFGQVVGLVPGGNADIPWQLLGNMDGTPSAHIDPGLTTQIVFEKAGMYFVSALAVGSVGPVFTTAVTGPEAMSMSLNTFFMVSGGTSSAAASSDIIAGQEDLVVTLSQMCVTAPSDTMTVNAHNQGTDNLRVAVFLQVAQVL